MSFSESPFSQPYTGLDNSNPIFDSVNLHDEAAMKPDIFAVLAGGKKSKTPTTMSRFFRRIVTWIIILLVVTIVPVALAAEDIGDFLDKAIGSLGPFLLCLSGPIVVLGIFFGAIIVPFYWIKAALNNGEYERAIKRSKFVKSFPYFRAIGLFLEGTSHSFAGNWAESEQALRANLALVGEQPTASNALENLGNVLVAQRRYAEAVQCFEHAIATDPSNSGAFNGLAEVYLYQGLNPQRALALAGRALEIKLSPQKTLVDEYMVAEMLMNKAWAFQLMGQSTAADETIKQAFEWAEVKFKPVLAGLYFRAGKIMHLRNKGIEARQYLHQAMETDPNGGYAKLALRAIREL